MINKHLRSQEYIANDTMHHLVMSVVECTNSSAPLELSIASATISALLLLVTVPTNLLVCLAIIVDPNNELRTQFNCFTFNLALADLIVGCVAEPLSIYIHITEALDSEHDHEVSEAVFMVFHIPYFISAMASVLSIAALACERYLAINLPFRYRQYFSIKAAIIFSMVIWTIALIFGLLTLVFHYTFESFIFINTGFLFTGFLVCFVYCKIRINLERKSELWTENPLQQERNMVIQIKLTKTFSLMIGMLMICYIPACSMIYFMNLCKTCNCDLIQWFRDSSFWLVLLNSAINPYVYAVRSSAFRKAIMKIMKCKCRQTKKLGTFSSIKFSKERGNVNTYRYGSILDTSSDSGGHVSL